MGQGATAYLSVTLAAGAPPGPVDGSVTVSLTDDDLSFDVLVTATVVGCPVGSDSCDGDWANGCEVDLTSDAGHCGACGAATPRAIR